MRSGRQTVQSRPLVSGADRRGRCARNVRRTPDGRAAGARPRSSRVPASPCATRKHAAGPLPARRRLARLRQRVRAVQLADREPRLERLRRRGDPTCGPADHGSRRFPETSLHRPLDVAFVATALQRSLGEIGLIDPDAHRADRLLHGRLRRAGGGWRRARSREPARAAGPGWPDLRPMRVAARSARHCACPASRRWSRSRRPAGRSVRGAPTVSRRSGADAPHRRRPRLDGGLPDGRTRLLRPGGQQQPLPADLPGRRPSHRPRACARRNARPAMGPGLVRGPGVERGADRRHQPALHHGLPRPLREGQRKPRSLSRRPRCRAPGKVPGHRRRAALRRLQPGRATASRSGRDSSASMRRDSSSCTLRRARCCAARSRSRAHGRRARRSCRRSRCRRRACGPRASAPSR